MYAMYTSVVCYSLTNEATLCVLCVYFVCTLCVLCVYFVCTLCVLSGFEVADLK